MSFLERLLEDPVRFKRLRRGFHVVLAVLVLAEIATWLLREGHNPIEHVPAGSSIYGLISCVAIIVLSKLIGKLWLMRSEDYYDSGEEGPTDA